MILDDPDGNLPDDLVLADLPAMQLQADPES